MLLRAPDDPRVQITKRLIGIDGDVVWDDIKRAPEVIGQVIRRLRPDVSPHKSDISSVAAALWSRESAGLREITHVEAEIRGVCMVRFT
jgi:hypothetical protein